MEIKKQCMICGKKLALGSCKMCGKLVCEDHMDKGLCVDCKKGPNV